MKEEIIKNWVTIPRANVEKALKWSKKHTDYITNDYAVIGGRKEHYQKGDDYDNFDFFFVWGPAMEECDKLFGVKND